MSFFQDLKNAAKDLSEHGLNLDNLQEEVGCEKREPYRRCRRRGARLKQ